MTYYACANNGTDRYGILAVTKVKGQPIQQDWTGEAFTEWDDAVARVEALNRELFAAVAS